MKDQDQSNKAEVFVPKTSIVLRKLLCDHNLNAIELSRALNIPNQTIYQLLNKDDACPKISTLLPIAKFFKITIGQLIGDEPLDSNKTTTDEPLKWTTLLTSEERDVVLLRALTKITARLDKLGVPEE